MVAKERKAAKPKIPPKPPPKHLPSPLRAPLRLCGKSSPSPFSPYPLKTKSLKSNYTVKTPFILLALAATTSLAFAQGPLAPSAAPAPTMKTLAQIEARTPIPASPAVPIAGPHFTITQPGSYYLTGNITVTTGDGILINASDVNLDLNGFTIASTLTGSSAGSAIGGNTSISRITVRNGSIFSGTTVPAPMSLDPLSLAGFRDGILLGSESLVSAVHIRGVGRFGIYVFRRGIIENCTTFYTGSTGILAEEGSVRNSNATLSGGVGIQASTGTVTSCIAGSNLSSGIFAFNGTISYCTATSNGEHGFSVLGSVISNSRADGNFKNGILVGEGVATHCRADGNSVSPSVDKQIDISAFPLGQRIGCIPATE
jgi:hypothetical protein